MSEVVDFVLFKIAFIVENTLCSFEDQQSISLESMSLTIKTVKCDGRHCRKCGKCREHGARAGARDGASAGVLSIGALAGVSVFLVAVLGPMGAVGIMIAIGGAALSTAGGAAVGAGIGATLGSVGGKFCEGGICKCRRKH
ncbi:unnamed protein product [Adineta steineri]|uniref:Uncharacterized protein n=1 Tax=Adineta steineri TaxID=433720 RepID=A0A815ARQ9_9BILA|nr:unnamed protein product [Adineta steineri]